MEFEIINEDGGDGRIGPGTVLTFCEATPLVVHRVLVNREEDFRFVDATVGIGADCRWFLVTDGCCTISKSSAQLARRLWKGGETDPSDLDLLSKLGWLALDAHTVSRSSREGVRHAADVQA